MTPELDQHIITVIQELCRELAIVDYGPTGVRWNWATARELAFETRPPLDHGQAMFYRGLQSALGTADWKPLLCYSLVRGLKRKRNPFKFLLGLFLPIIGFLVLEPVLLPSLRILDLILVVPLIVLGILIANFYWGKQRDAADRLVSNMVGKEALLHSLRALETYLTNAITPENSEKLTELATQDMKAIYGVKDKSSIWPSLKYSLDETRKRIRALQRN